MNAIRLFLILSAVLLGGCESDSHNALYGPAVVGTTVHDSMRRALTRHVWARPGMRLDDFEKIVQQQENNRSANFFVPDSTNAVREFSYEGRKAIYCGWFIKEETTRKDFTPDFSADEIREPMVLAAKLKEGSDPVSSWLYSQLSKREREMVAGKNATAGKLKEVLAAELTALVHGPLLYDEKRFKGVSLRPRTASLLGFKTRFQPSQRALAQFYAALNRLLLEDAYPRELTKEEIFQWKHYYVAVRH